MAWRIRWRSLGVGRMRGALSFEPGCCGSLPALTSWPPGSGVLPGQSRGCDGSATPWRRGLPALVVVGFDATPLRRSELGVAPGVNVAERPALPTRKARQSKRSRAAYLRLTGLKRARRAAKSAKGRRASVPRIPGAPMMHPQQEAPMPTARPLAAGLWLCLAPGWIV